MSDFECRPLLFLLLLVLPTPVRSQTTGEIEAVFWRSVQCEKAAEVRLYLEEYPNGRYVAEARTCLEQGLGLDRATRILVQQGLTALDYSAGAPDGLFGPATREAIRAWQAGKGFSATEYLTEAQAEALVEQGRRAAVEARTEAERQRQAREAAARAEAERQRRAREEAARQRPRQVRNSIGMEFVRIEAGTFQMGSNDGDDDERPVHRVRISQPFYLGKYEVTRSEFGRFVEATGYTTGNSCWTYESGEWEEHSGRSWRAPGYRQSGTDPVVCVSWEDAQAYAGWVSRATEEAYRLPTEAEWEYAARGGRESRGYVYAGSNRLSAVGWYRENSGRQPQPHPVGQKQPNELGLYDMSGNVWEWVQDWYDDDYYSSSPATDPHGPATGARRVYRGGSWNYLARYCRAAYRNRAAPGYRNSYLGVRLARTP